MKRSRKLRYPFNTIRIVLAGLLFIWSGCTEPGGTADAPAAGETGSHAGKQQSAPQAVEVVVFSNDSLEKGSGWGYDVFLDNSETPYIHQPIIPAIPGEQGFTSAGDARKAGALVAYKIRNHIMPPAVTPAELDSLGISLPQREAP